MRNRASARGRAIAAGRDVIAQLVVTGDRNAFFVGGYQRLAEAYIDPWQAFERARLDRFVPRTSLLRELDGFLSGGARGYFLIEAKAGLGKSTFLAQLVRERNWIHHFVEEAPGGDGVIPARRSLAAQLVRAYELDDLEYAGNVLSDEASSRPDYLARLMRAAAERRSGEPIVVVVDGLDQAGVRPGENVLGLPRVLPDGVFVVCSTRPGPLDLHVETRRKLVTIEPLAPENREDLREFITRVSDMPAVRAALSRSDYDRRHVIDALAEKSEGLWIYVHYLVEDLERGTLALDLDDLPVGLSRYYYDFWRRWQSSHEGAWRSEHLPLLATLAVVQSSLTLELLGAFAGTNGEPEVPDRWLPFLAVDWAAQPRYRLYHRSLADYVANGSEIESYGEADRLFADELRRAADDAHRRVVDRCLESLGLRAALGRDGGSPHRSPSSTEDAVRQYGLRHVVHHMLAHAEGDVDRLLVLEARGRPGAGASNVWFSEHARAEDVQGYLSDVAIVWRDASATTRAELEQGKPGSRVASEFAYALITNRVRGLSRRIPSRLRVALVQHGVWSRQRAIDDARQLPVDESSVALAQLASVLSPEEAERIVSEAFELAQSIEDQDTRAAILAALAPNLTPRLVSGLAASLLAPADRPLSRYGRLVVIRAFAPALPDALVQEMIEQPDGTAARDAVEMLAPVLPDDVVPQALLIARAAAEDGLAGPLIALAARIDPADFNSSFASVLKAAADSPVRDLQETSLVEQLVDAIDTLPDALITYLVEYASTLQNESTSDLLVGLAHRLPPGLARRAASVARTNTFGVRRWLTLAAVAPKLPNGDSQRAIGEVRSWADSARDEQASLGVLVELAVRLDGPRGDALVDQVLERARGLTLLFERARLLLRLAEARDSRRVPVLLELVRGLAEDSTKARAIRLLIPHSPESSIEDLLDTIATIGDGSRTWLLDLLAPRLPQRLTARALEVALAEPDAARARILAELGRLLRSAKRDQAFAQACDAVKSIESADIRDRTVRKLLRLAELDARQALRLVRLIDDEWQRSLAARDLVEAHPAELTQEMLSLASELEGRARSAVLSALAPSLPEALLERAWACACAISDRDARGEALAALAPWLPEALAGSALEEALKLESRYERGLVLAEAAGRSRGPTRTQALSEFDKAIAMTDDTKALVGSAEEMMQLLGVDASTIEQTVEPLIKAVGDSFDLIVTAAMSAHLPEPERTARLKEVLLLADAVEEASIKASTLARIAPYLTGADSRRAYLDALAWTLAIPDVDERVRELNELISMFPDELVSEVLPPACALAETTSQAMPLAAIAPRLPATLHERVLDAAAAVEKQSAKAEIIAALAPALSPDLVPRGFALSRSLEETWARSYAFTAIAPFLSEQLAAEAFQLAWSAEGDDYVGSLIALIPRIPDDLVDEAFEFVETIENSFSLRSGLLAIAPRLSVGQLSRAIELSSRAVDWPGTTPLEELLGCVLSGPPAHVYRVWSELIARGATERDADLLSASAIFDGIEMLGGAPAVEAAFSWVERVDRWWPASPLSGRRRRH